MRILSIDVAGSNTVRSLADILANDGGYTLPDPAEAYGLFIIENSPGTTSSRIGGPDVSATRGIPLAAISDVVRLMPVSGRVGDVGTWLWSLTDTYLWLGTGDVISITAFCK